MCPLEWNDIAKGFLYTHSRLNATTGEQLEAASFLYGLIDLLSAKGLISIEDLETRRNEMAERLERKFRKQEGGVRLQEPEQDKYAFEGEVQIDCENRIPLCRAACCKLPFPLSRQDVREGVVQWDLADPYMIAQGTDGYCVHMNRENHGCGIRDRRPVPCRAYDCRNEKRIWLDFENRIINPEILSDNWPWPTSDAGGEP
jgi:hypothetical protein